MVLLSGSVSVNSAPKQWTYRLTVVLAEKSIVIEYPLTCQFNIVRNTFAQSNTGNFTIYNLSSATRSLIFQDRFNTSEIKGITFEVGYEGELSLIFKGNIQQAYSKRQGTDILTEIQAWDIGIAQEPICATFESGTTYKEAYKNVITTSGLTLGVIGDLNGEFKQPTTFVGQPLDVLNQITGNHTFIDNGIVHTLQDNEAIDTGVTVLKGDTGLIGTPERRDAQVVAQSILNPKLVVGQLLEIDSTTAKEFSGTYAIMGLSHEGIISGSVAGSRITTINLMNDTMLPNSNVNTTGNTETPTFKKVKGEEVSTVNKTYSASVYDVYKYIRANNGAIPNKQINPRISWQEMLGHNNKPSERMSELTIPILQNCQNTANKLYNFLQTYYPDKPIRVASGWRSTANNKREGGVANSRHLTGQAIDFKFMNINTTKAFWSSFVYWTNFTYLNNFGSIHVQTTGVNKYRNKR